MQGLFHWRTNTFNNESEVYLNSIQKIKMQFITIQAPLAAKAWSENITYLKNKLKEVKLAKPNNLTSKPPLKLNHQPHINLIEIP